MTDVHSHNRFRFKRFDNKFIRPYLLRNHQGAEPKILETYSKLTMKDAMEYIRRNASTIGNISGTESMSAIFRNYSNTGQFNGRSVAILPIIFFKVWGINCDGISISARVSVSSSPAGILISKSWNIIRRKKTWRTRGYTTCSRRNCASRTNVWVVWSNLKYLRPLGSHLDRI